MLTIGKTYFSIGNNLQDLITQAEIYEESLYDKLKLGEPNIPREQKLLELKNFLTENKKRGLTPNDFFIENKINKNKVYELFDENNLYRFTTVASLKDSSGNYHSLPAGAISLLKKSKERSDFAIGNISEIIDMIYANDIIDKLSQYFKDFGHAKIETNDNFYKNFENTLKYDIEIDIHPKNSKQNIPIYLESKAKLDNFHIADIKDLLKNDTDDFYSSVRKVCKQYNVKPTIETKLVKSDEWGDIYDAVIEYELPNGLENQLAAEILRSKLSKTPIFSSNSGEEKIKLSSEVLKDLSYNNKTSLYIDYNEKFVSSYNSSSDIEYNEAMAEAKDETNELVNKKLYDVINKLSLWYGKQK